MLSYSFAALSNCHITRASNQKDGHCKKTKGLTLVRRGGRSEQVAGVGEAIKSCYLSQSTHFALHAKDTLVFFFEEKKVTFLKLV